MEAGKAYKLKDERGTLIRICIVLAKYMVSGNKCRSDKLSKQLLYAFLILLSPGLSGNL